MMAEVSTCGQTGQPCHLLPTWPWASHFTSLSFIHKMRVTMLTNIDSFRWVARKSVCAHSNHAKHGGYYHCYPGGAGSRLTKRRRGHFRDRFLRLQKVEMNSPQREWFVLYMASCRPLPPWAPSRPAPPSRPVLPPTCTPLPPVLPTPPLLLGSEHPNPVILAWDGEAR